MQRHAGRGSSLAPSRSRPPPSFQSKKNWGFLACYSWRSALLLHSLWYLLPLWSHSFPSFYFFHLMSSFHKYLLRPTMRTFSLGTTVNKTNCGWLSHILHCRGIRSHTNGQEYVSHHLIFLWVTRLSESHEEFPGNPVVRLSALTPGAWGSTPGQGTKIPQSCGVAKKGGKSHEFL